MAEGFIFDQDKCVGCKACVAACNIINGYNTGFRKVLSSGGIYSSSIGILNLSMSCNHCSNALCLTGCPSGAIYRDELTGAILVSESECIGCSYCSWNCPYDAPAIKDAFMTKCNLCIDHLRTGYKPSCATACPTGALQHGAINTSGSRQINWFPAERHNPSIEIKPQRINDNVEVIPDGIFDNKPLRHNDYGNKVTTEWSLLLFTFISSVAAALQLTFTLTGYFPLQRIFMPFLLIMAALVSVLHLRRKTLPLKALFNIRRSPLSREILFFTLFSAFSLISLWYSTPLINIAASATALIFIISVDYVYNFSSPGTNTLMHPGQVFLSVLGISSMISGQTTAFIFISILKIFLYIRILYIIDYRDITFGFRYLRLAILLLIIPCVLNVFTVNEVVLLAVVIFGEFIDRYLFYNDFRPLKVKDLFSQ